jgi:aminoglycoside/choline kinase family phosphotransferase
MDNPTDYLNDLFLTTFHKEALQTTPLQQSGSYRSYYRLQQDSFSAIGVYNEDKQENKAFLKLSRHFATKGIHVPTVYAENLSDNVYLIQDLGNQTLYALLCDTRKDSLDFPETLIPLYKQALDGLLQLQLEGGKGLDFSGCYPRSTFDRQSISWDLNYFKYYFLKLANIHFDEQLLENDFHAFASFLLEADASFFLYRDFQSRNIMIQAGTLFFIDYQGGRKGALQYDVASLLYDGKAAIPTHIRQDLLSYYLEQLQKIAPQQHRHFMTYFDAFVFVRIMQAMGSYGFRGFYEKKAHFLQSIPYAVENLKHLLDTVQLPVALPALWDVFHQLIDSNVLKQYTCPKLKITICSFSYKEGIPADDTENGGGFVFDCRCLPNPGREDGYKTLTGKDKAIIDYLNNYSEVNRFFEQVKLIVDMAVKNYISRNFRSLMVAFGCTGGRHRSVYFAQRLQDYLRKSYPVDTKLYHQRESEWNHEYIN